MISSASCLRLILVAGFFITTQCTWKSSTPENQIVVKVDSAELTSREFAQQLAQQLSRHDALSAKDPKNIKRVKDSLVNDFILTQALGRWAKSQGLEVSNQTLEAECQKIRMGFPDDLSFREELSKQNLSLNEWQIKVHKRLLETLAMENLAKKVPQATELEVQKYYEQNKSRYSRKDRIYISQIVLAENADADHIQAALRKGQTFEKLAKEFSVAPEAKMGGVIGWVERGTLEVFDKGFDLPLGKPSDIIQSPYGFHILLVTKKQPAGTLPLSEVNDAIKRELKAQKDQAYFAGWIEQQTRSLHVFKNQSLIDAMVVETRKD